MAKYVPKVNDPVFVSDLGKARYVIISVDAAKQTVSVQTTFGHVSMENYDVAWSRLVPLDISQNALQIVREATEDK